MAVMRARDGAQGLRWIESRAERYLQGLDVKVWRKYDDFVEELSERFPHERKGIEKFYGECWAVFNSLNSLELKSLEEPRYLLGGVSFISASLFLLQWTSSEIKFTLCTKPPFTSCIWSAERAAHPDFASQGHL